MDIDQIESFCTVAEYKSFRKAAEMLKVTQPGISRRIKGLENELGVSLLQRTPQSVSLTPQGKTFLPYAERSLKIFKEGLKQTMNERIEEKLVIGGTPTVCITLLPDLIKEFTSKFDISVTLCSGPSSQIFDRLVDQTIDLGFTSAFFSSSLLTTEKIFSEKIVCVGSPDFVKTYMHDKKIIKKPIPTIVNNLNTDPWRGISDYLNNNLAYTCSLMVDTTYIAEKMARKGIGLAFLPLSDAFKGLTTGELIKVHLSDFELPTRPVYMMSYKDRQLPPAAVRFKNIVSDFIAVTDP